MPAQQRARLMGLPLKAPRGDSRNRRLCIKYAAQRFAEHMTKGAAEGAERRAKNKADTDAWWEQKGAGGTSGEEAYASPHTGGRESAGAEGGPRGA